MKEAGQRWTLAFRDGDLEADYRGHSARRYRRHVIVMSIVCIAAWLLMGPFDRTVGGTADNAAAITQIRLIVGALSLLALLVVWLTRYRLPSLGRQLWCVVFLASFMAIQLMIVSAPSPEAHATEYQSAGFILIMLVALLAAPVRFVHMAAPTALVCASHVWVLANYTDHAAIFAPLIIVAYAVGFASVATMEQSRRRTFILARLLDAEREKSDALLHNMLPESIAAQLKRNEGRIAEHHEEATVLFADIVGFTPMSERMSAPEVVRLLDEVFSLFDAKVEELGLEKIKTIGDGYMAVGGVPDPRRDHVEAVAELALALPRIVAELPAQNGVTLALRVGMDTGPLVAGVIGTSKLVYDLWGDTVNTASRMESHADDGTIQVTAAVNDRLQDDYVLRRRGEVEIKGKGSMTTFLLLERRKT